MLLDLRYAVRALLRRPAFSTLAILTLAVGIGVNAVAFTAVSALLFKPVSFDGAERLAWIMTSVRGNPHGQTSWADFLDLQQARSFDQVIAELRAPLAWQDGGQARQIWGLLVTANYFSALETRAEQGRVFVPADRNGALTAIVSHRFWRTQLGGGPVGKRTISINKHTCIVVGVLRDGFQGPGGLYEPDVWLPLEQARVLRLTGAAVEPSEPVLNVIARMRDGATPVQARAELAGLSRALDAKGPADFARSLTLYPMTEGHPEVRGMTPIVWLAMSVVGVVLLIACFNVASLLLARAAERRREISVRAALGASRWRIVRQLLAEGAVLSGVAGLAAVALAATSGRLLTAFSLPAPIPQRLHMGVDGRVIAFTLTMVTVATLLPSVLPAWHATRRRALRMQEALVASGRRMRSAFVIAQIAGSTVFLAAALLFVRSYWNASSTDPGFDSRQTVVAELSPFQYGYDAHRTEGLAEAVVAGLRALPGVRGASVADRVPFFVGFASTDTYTTAGDCSAGRCPAALVYRVGPGHFRTLAIPLREGREFGRREPPSRAIISTALAVELWPGQSAVGKVIRVGRDGDALEVIGVTADAKLRSLSERPAAVIYRPWSGDHAHSGLSIVVQTSGDARSMLGAVRDALSSADHTLPAQSLQTMRERMAVPLWPARTLAGFFAVCGALSVLLATVGLFGVTYYLVHQRTREFGVRMALGASRERIMRVVLSDGVRVALIGTVLGAAGAFVTARLLSRALVDISPGDPLTYTMTAALQVAIALAAGALPAWQASKADPIEALRSE